MSTSSQSTSLPVTLDDALISKLAREVARNIIPIPDLQKTFKLDEVQFDRIVDTPFFQQRLVEEQAIWNASDPMSAATRIKAKSTGLIEELLIDAYTQFQDPDHPLSAKVELLKWISRMGGLGENANVKGGGIDGDAKVKITINIGGQKLEFDKEKLPGRVINATDVVDLTPSSAS